MVQIPHVLKTDHSTQSKKEKNGYLNIIQPTHMQNNYAHSVWWTMATPMNKNPRSTALLNYSFVEHVYYLRFHFLILCWNSLRYSHWVSPVWLSIPTAGKLNLKCVARSIKSPVTMEIMDGRDRGWFTTISCIIVYSLTSQHHHHLPGS